MPCLSLPAETLANAPAEKAGEGSIELGTTASLSPPLTACMGSSRDGRWSSCSVTCSQSVQHVAVLKEHVH